MTDGAKQESEYEGRRVLAEGVRVDNDTRKTGRNNNDLIIGPTGAGKTRGYVIPNLLHSQESLIVADTKGNLRKLYGPYLEAEGYRVVDIDFVDMVHSPCGYNPLDYVRRDSQTGNYTEQDIMTVATAVCPDEKGNWDPYWNQAAQMSASALIGLVLMRMTEEDRDMSSVCRLAQYSGSKKLAVLFKELDDFDPECYAARQYRLVHINDDAEKMTASVRGILINALNPMSFDGPRHLFKHCDRIDFRRIGHEKTAVFLTVSDTDRSLDRLVNLTPCLVMTEYQVPKYFTVYNGKTKETRHDFNRIDLLITDEAGQVNTPVAMASFALAKKAMVVGDTHQLAPIWGLTEEADQAIALESGMPEAAWEPRKAAGLTCSEPASVMRAATNACAWRYSEQEAGLFLEEHYRCVNGIIEFCNELIYKKTRELKPSRGVESKVADKVKSPFMFKVVEGSEDRRAGSSRVNQVEADAIMDWIQANREALEALYADEDDSGTVVKRPIDKIVGVVTPFSAQSRCIRQAISKRDAKLAKSITVGTAHRLQGAERPVILFSAVYGNKSDDAGFVNSMPELMNVAVSRAKDVFIMLGAEKRRKDTGDVFKVINDFAVLDDCMFVEASAEPEQPVRRSMSAWSRDDSWKQAFASGKAPKVREANQVLQSAGLIAKDAEGVWEPTSEGTAAGIIRVDGVTKDGKPFKGLEYTAEAAAYVLEILKVHFDQSER